MPLKDKTRNRIRRSCFHGWQIQNNANTVQEEIERAVYKITGEQTK